MKNNLVYIFFILLLPAIISAQKFPVSNYVTDTLYVNLNNSYQIKSLNILPFTDRIRISSRWLNLSDYKIEYSSGTFSFSQNVKYSLTDTIFISYETIKLNLKKEYKRRSLTYSLDDRLVDTIRVIKTETPLTAESFFGRDLQKSGAIVRGFTFGTNKDFTLNSGLRLQLSGKLSDDIDLVAALTDENTPIQPEGNTETLQEFDKVFIELRHKNAIGTFGDYELNLKDNEFSQITRKLQGLKGEVIFGDTKGTVAIATSRGKFNTNQFNGQDGNQGPYRLYGANNESAIILIAGSERVFIDGELMKRGENNDYVIDYSNAEITFTAKKLITSASRVSIDFEYTDLNYSRNFFGADFSTKLFNDKLKIGIGYFREGDNETNPIDLSLTDSDIDLLKAAGNDRSKATKSGVSLATADSTGKIQGIYTKIDTVINSQSFSYYKYAPGSSSSIYNVSFTYVGSGNGDYVKESLGQYKFVGKKSGSYMPVIYLPLPEMKQLGNLSLSADIFTGVKLNFDFSGSDWNKNKFSTLDKDDDFGYAQKLSLDVLPQDISLGNTSIGKIGFNLKDRFIQGKYSSLDRINEVEFNRYYNVPSDTSQDQILREASINYLPTKNISLESKYGYLKQGNAFSSNRFYSHLKADGQKEYYLDYTFDYVKSNYSLVSTSWTKQNGKASYALGFINPGIEFLYENKEEKNTEKDSVLSTSLKYQETAPFLELNGIPNFSLHIGYSTRNEYFPIDGKMTKQSDAYTQNYQAAYRGLKEFTTSLTVTFRDKKYTEEFKKLNYSNNQTVLIMSQSRFNFGNGFIQGDLFYQAATEQSAKLEKVFVRVTKGTGSYIYLGDLNENGIADESEFQLTSYDGEYTLVTVSTDKLYPVMDLKTNTRWRIDFARIFQEKSFLASVLKPVSSETSWRVEENSKDEDTKQIYLLNFSKFLNDSTTIQGSQQFQHDVNVFQNNSDLSFRLRYLQRKSLNQYSGGIERGYYRERGIRIRFKMIEEINNQTDYTIQDDNLISPASTKRARTVNRNDLTTDFSYRPVRDIEIGFKIETGRSIDELPSTPTTVDMNSLVLRANFSFENSGRLRVEIERTELTSNAKSSDIPYEVTKGNVIGKNYFWRVYFDYRLSNFIQTSLSYDARLQGGSRVIQTMRAEARAYF